MQGELVEGFSHLFKSHHFDAREAAVLSLHRIVGTCGHVLDEGWGIIIKELSMITGTIDVSSQPEPLCVPEYTPKEVAKLVPIAFKAVQLIVDDFLPGLGLESQKDLARCIRAFGDQEPHVNISLTSITMLWTMCDHVQKDCPDPLRASAVAQAGLPRQQQQLQQQQLLQVENCNALLLFVFEQLNHLCLDQRPEVRNCAVRTLCSIIVASAPKLTMDSWRICNMGVLFPLLDEIIMRGSKAPTELVHGEVLGRLSGERTRVHHSLDTLEKQWRETIVTTIQGATRVVRATVQYAGHMEWTLKTWEIMLDTVRSTLVRQPQNKVALAASRSLQELAALVTGGSKARFAAVGMQVVNGALVRVDSEGQAESAQNPITVMDDGVQIAPGTPLVKLWEMAWAVYESATQVVATPPAPSVEPSRATGAATGVILLAGVGTIEVAADIVTGLGELFASGSAQHMLRAPELLRKCLALLTRLLCAFPAKSKHITGLERAVLGTVESLPPVPDVVWPVLFTTLRGYMRSPSELGMSAAFADKAQALFVALFEKHAPSAARALVFEDTIAGLTASLNMGPEERAARSGAEARAGAGPEVAWDIQSLLPIFKLGLRSLSTCGWLSSRVEDVWMNLLQVLTLILGKVQESGPLGASDEEQTGASGAPSSQPFDLSVEDGLQLLNVVMEEARPLILASCVPSGVQDRLFELLHGGCSARRKEPASQSAPAGNSFVLSRACLEHLLTLSSVSSSDSEQLSHRVLSTLVDGVEQVTEAFLAHGGDSDVHERDIVALLQKLRSLEIHSIPRGIATRINSASLEAAGNKAHLLLLFPTLNRLVTVDSLQVRSALQAIFADLAESLMLGSGNGL